MEIWDVYDIDRQKTGKRMDRGAEFEDDAYTCVMHICIFNSKGEMLIQQRQSFKRTWPNLWDLSVGGHTEAGETSRMSAERELFEVAQLSFVHVVPSGSKTVWFSRSFLWILG